MRRGEAADKYKSPLRAEQQGNILALSSRSARRFFFPQLNQQITIITAEGTNKFRRLWNNGADN